MKENNILGSVGNPTFVSWRTMNKNTSYEGSFTLPSQSAFHVMAHHSPLPLNTLMTEITIIHLLGNVYRTKHRAQTFYFLLFPRLMCI